MKNNKISLIFIGIFFLCAGCSFDSKTGIWSGDEKEKERIGQIEKDGKKDIEKIYASQDISVDEVIEKKT